MNIKDKAGKERDRFMERTDTNRDGKVSAAEARARAEAEIGKRPWRAVAIVAALVAAAVGAFVLLGR
jgi:ElaB/YqjD/DUF883 family membrane-anchored ribosome-binding protein